MKSSKKNLEIKQINTSKYLEENYLDLYFSGGIGYTLNSGFWVLVPTSAVSCKKGLLAVLTRLFIIFFRHKYLMILQSLYSDKYYELGRVWNFERIS